MRKICACFDKTAYSHWLVGQFSSLFKTNLALYRNLWETNAAHTGGYPTLESTSFMLVSLPYAMKKRLLAVAGDDFDYRERDHNAGGYSLIPQSSLYLIAARYL